MYLSLTHPLFLRWLITLHEFGSVSDLLDYINPSQDGKGREALAMKRKPYNAKVLETALYTKYVLIFVIINGETQGFILFALVPFLYPSLIFAGSSPTDVLGFLCKFDSVDRPLIAIWFFTPIERAVVPHVPSWPECFVLAESLSSYLLKKRIGSDLQTLRKV